jgi:hypothetical protein
VYTRPVIQQLDGRPQKLDDIHLVVSFRQGAEHLRHAAGKNILAELWPGAQPRCQRLHLLQRQETGLKCLGLRLGVQQGGWAHRDEQP